MYLKRQDNFIMRVIMMFDQIYQTKFLCESVNDGVKYGFSINEVLQSDIYTKEIEKYENIPKAKLEDVCEIYYEWIQSRCECPYCKNDIRLSDASVDHKKPVIYLGTHEKENLVVCCLSCNIKRYNSKIFVQM